MELHIPSVDVNQWNSSIGSKITDSRLNWWFSNQWMVPRSLAPKAALLGCQPRKQFPWVDTLTKISSEVLNQFWIGWGIASVGPTPSLPWMATSNIGCSHPRLVFWQWKWIYRIALQLASTDRMGWAFVETWRLRIKRSISRAIIDQVKGQHLGCEINYYQDLQ
jgi:hypothetical protein